MVRKGLLLDDFTTSYIASRPGVTATGTITGGLKLSAASDTAPYPDPNRGQMR